MLGWDLEPTDSWPKSLENAIPSILSCHGNGWRLPPLRAAGQCPQGGLGGGGRPGRLRFSLAVPPWTLVFAHLKDMLLGEVLGKGAAAGLWASCLCLSGNSCFGGNWLAGFDENRSYGKNTEWVPDSWGSPHTQTGRLWPDPCLRGELLEICVGSQLSFLLTAISSSLLATLTTCFSAIPTPAPQAQTSL